MSQTIDNSGSVINCNGVKIVSSEIIDSVKNISANTILSSSLYVNTTNVYLTMIKLFLQLSLVNSNDAYRLEMEYMDFQGLDLSDMDLSRVVFRGSNFAGANLSGCDLSNSDLTGVNLSCANLTGANISGATITGITGVDAIVTDLTANETIGTPLAPFGSSLSVGATFNSFDGYFNDSITYNAIPRTGLANASTGTVTNLSSLALSTNGNFIDNNGQIQFTVTWNGFFKAQVTGMYEFSLRSDDGSYFWLNTYQSLRKKTNVTIDNSTQHPAITKSAKVNLLAGCYYPFFMIFGQNLGDYTCSLTFTHPPSDSINNSRWFYR